MLRCIEIAKNGLGTTAPNPMVGCVIVHNKKIIGEGFTSTYGGAHAEVSAIGSVTDKRLLKEATLYVTLEPCSHYGKTPPCVNLILENQIPKVVIGLTDPHDKVDGEGIKKLKNAGCNVLVGVLQKECREHHKRFLTFHEKKRPYIILKWAETTDGFIAPAKDLRLENPEPFWITNVYSRQFVHKWRSEEQAILVGTKTVLEDNPKLDVRHWTGKAPMRIVLDRNLSIPADYHVLDASIDTLIVTEEPDLSKQNKDLEYAIINFSSNLASQVCKILNQKSITSLIIEGGGQTLQTFIDVNLWDEARVFTGNTSFRKGVKAPSFSGALIDSKNITSDTLKIYYND